ncbi:unnamed protein product [Durusdinium trenchii]|uniref:7(1) septoil knot domain-containing protein n=2 Tax=Durusdinium trenchii TaxID=1381693 RepID=A0ABP0JYB1_9DINO
MIGFFGYLLVIAAGNSAFQAELHADDECGEGAKTCSLEALQLRANRASCYFHGIFLAGKVKVVSHFPDIKVKLVDSFPDLEVKKVSHFPDRCGEWQIVENFPDFTVQFVSSFPDVKIRYVTSFPGVYQR